MTWTTDRVHMIVRKHVRPVLFNIDNLYSILLVSDYTFQWYTLTNYSNVDFGDIGHNSSKHLRICHKSISCYICVFVIISIYIGSLQHDTMLTWFKWKHGSISTRKNTIRNVSGDFFGRKRVLERQALATTMDYDVTRGCDVIRWPHMTFKHTILDRLGTYL